MCTTHPIPYKGKPKLQKWPFKLCKSMNQQWHNKIFLQPAAALKEISSPDIPEAVSSFLLLFVLESIPVKINFFITIKIIIITTTTTTTTTTIIIIMKVCFKIFDHGSLN